MTAQRRSRLLDTDPHYPTLKDRFIQATGMIYYTDRDSTLIEKIVKRLDALDLVDCKEYLAYLDRNIQGPSEMDLLIADLTIGETYFFRNLDQFDLLQKSIFPAIIEKNSMKRQLRIWSAGCSIGAEPYSLAIVLKEHFGSMLKGWDVSILASDINREYLARASEGIFDEWAFRGCTPAFKEGYFTPVGKKWKISSEIGKYVKFQYHNLLKHPYPSLINNLEALDLIMCRNVMIYFDTAICTEILKHFQESLSPGGWLILGHSEAPLNEKPFNVIQMDGSVAYQKESAPGSFKNGSDHGGGQRRLQPQWQSGIQPSSQFQSPQKVSNGTGFDDKTSKPLDISLIRKSADRGDFSTAIAYCESFVKTHALDALGHFYYGLILEQMGRRALAIEQLLASDRLDPKSAVTCYYLGLIYQSEKSKSEAIRWFEKGKSILEETSDGHLFRDADGISAQELRQLMVANLEILNLGRGS